MQMMMRPSREHTGLRNVGTSFFLRVMLSFLVCVWFKN